jgi:regulator of protease activity HflC (stomatin/prohibitin superfamily)
MAFNSGEARSRRNALLNTILVADTISGPIMSLIVYERTVRYAEADQAQCNIGKEFMAESGPRRYMFSRGPFLLTLIAFSLLLDACGNTVQPGQRGLRWRPFSTGLSAQPLTSGFYWRAPWNDLYIYDIKWQSHMENIDGMSSDGLKVLVKAAIILRPLADEIHFLQQEVGTDFYGRMVKPEFVGTVRSVLANYPMVTIPENSVAIASKVQAVVEEKLKGRHLEIQSVALADVDFPPAVLHSIEQKQAKEQQKEQKEFELTIAHKDAEIARLRASGEGDAIAIRAEGEADALQIRAAGQARAQELIRQTITPAYLQFKLYNSLNPKTILLPDDTLDFDAPNESSR